MREQVSYRAGGERVPWIESHQELLRHRKTRRLAARLGVDLPTAIGHLHILWWWALEHAKDGDLTGMDPAEIASVMEWRGEPGTLFDALLWCGDPGAAGFLEWKGGRLLIHDWHQGRPSRGLAGVIRRAWYAVAAHAGPAVFRRDDYTCRLCGRRGGPLEVDHIVPVARGGENDPDNLQTLCRGCNRRKGAS